MQNPMPLESLTIGALLRRTARRFPGRPALETPERLWSYEELDEQVDRCARRLLTWGVRRGDHLGIWCETEPNAVILFYAAARIGAVAVLFNTWLCREELKELLLRTDVTVLAIGDGYKDICYPEVCRDLIRQLPRLREIRSIGVSDDRRGFPLLTQLSAAPEAALEEAEAAVRPEDTACIIFTSGTTSCPKAVMSSHDSRVNSGIQQAHDLGAAETDRFCVAMPIFHCFCLSVNVVAACAAGACLFLPASRRTRALLEAVQDHKCSVMSCVPTLYHALIRRRDFPGWDLSTLRVGFIGGSLYPPALFRAVDAAFGPQFTLLSSLGQTEATAGITTTCTEDPLEVRANTIGHFMNHVEGRIAALGTNRPLPPGRSGEICVRGYVVMQGYYAQPQETCEAIDADGWLHTGDTGFLDAQGNIHLTGRLKELIIRGGENISPAEIELAAAEVPGLAACKAVGVPDEHYGEEVCLCAVAEGEPSCTEAELRTAFKRSLAEFKQPRYILFLERLPQTPTGKLKVTQIQAEARHRLGL